MDFYPKDEISAVPVLDFFGDALSDDELESLAGIDKAGATRGGTQACTCGGDATCHHHD